MKIRYVMGEVSGPVIADRIFISDDIDQPPLVEGYEFVEINRSTFPKDYPLDGILGLSPIKYNENDP